MYVVYWTDEQGPKSKKFGSDEMKFALTYSEELRKLKQIGCNISFVTICSENPNSVGHPGVDETGPDYDWKKRRQ